MVSSFLYQLVGQAAPPGDDIYDIVVLEPKESWTGLAFWLVIVLLLILAAAWIGWLLYRKNQRRHSTPTAEVKFARAFSRLRVDREQLAPNHFTQRLSDALKDYLTERFDEPVRYETTQEFLQRVSEKGSVLPEEARESLARFLVSSDEVKFANLSNADEKADPLLDQAAMIVKQCQPRPSGS